MNLELFEGIELVGKCREKLLEKEAWDIYLVQYQNMDKSNFITFADFMKQVKSGTTSTTESKEKKEEQMAKAECIKKLHQSKNKAQN